MGALRNRRLAVTAVVVTIAGVMIACGLEAVGSGPADGGGEGTSGSPGTPGSSGQPGTPGPGQLDGGTVLIGDDASSDAGADAGADADAAVIKDAAPDGAIVFVCPTGATTDCSTCGGGRTLGCVMCASAGSGIYAVCTPPGVSCYANYRPAGYTWCRCAAGNPASCILPKQGCNPYDNGVCVTCGENLTNGDPCKGGGSCNESGAKCQ